MSLFDRRAALILLTAAAGCGFKPLYRKDGGADALLGEVALQEAVTPEDFDYRERLRRRLGLTGAHAPDTARWRLDWSLRFEETGVAITRSSDVTRYQVQAFADYLLTPLSDDSEPIRGALKTNGAYDATASAYASRAAKLDERKRLSIELAELTATRLLAHFAAGPS